MEHNFGFSHRGHQSQRTLHQCGPRVFGRIEVEALILLGRADPNLSALSVVERNSSTLEVGRERTAGKSCS